LEPFNCFGPTFSPLWNKISKKSQNKRVQGN
jgi:hypothetical protein